MTTPLIPVRPIPEDVVPGKRLGRHIAHDPRNHAYRVRARRVDSLRTVLHERRIPILDQGELGSCTGEATIGALGTDGLIEALTADQVRTLGQQLAESVYSLATELDPFPGQWRPDDTGSDGTSAAKAAQSMSLVSGYLHAMSLDEALTALQNRAVVTGVNWYSSFDEPDSSGRVTITPGAWIRGGHEFVARGVDMERREVYCDNSWSTGFGDKGSFRMSFDDWDRLLSEQGDVTMLLPRTAPAPEPTPTPAPAHSPAEDAAFIAYMKWKTSILSRLTKAGKLNDALHAFFQDEGYGI